MGNEAAAILPGGRRDEEAAVGRSELAQGLMLVRASSLKVVRLQLALERKDRRAALEAVDDLVHLDRRISNFLGDLAVPDDEELESQARLVGREKFTLAAGREGPALGAPARAAGAPAPLTTVRDPLEVELIAPSEEPEESSGWSSRLVAALLLLLLLGAGIAALFLLTGAEQEIMGGWDMLYGG